MEINQILDWQTNGELAGLPTVGADAHRSAMRNVAAGVSIVTTRCGEEIAGLTATAVCSVTADPPRLVVFVNKNTAASSLILQSGTLCANVLAADQEDVARAFAGMIEGYQGGERFKFGDWDHLVSGAPTLVKALVNLDCRVIKVFDESTHNAFLCEILGTRERGDGEALIYVNGRFQAVAL